MNADARDRTGFAIACAGLVVLALFVLVPLLATALGGLKTLGELRSEPFGVPLHPRWENYTGILAGGRYWRLLGNSLLIAGAATCVCLFFAAVLGIVAGYAGGWVDQVFSRLLDILWAFPVYLLAISLSVVLISSSLHIGPISIEANSLLLPIAIIGIVYVPYVARPVRGHVLSLAQSDFVLAATGLGVPNHRILMRDILPNVAPTLIVFAPLVMALNLLTESALSFLQIGVQPPAASWGTIIADGQTLIYSRPLVAVAPGLAIIATVLCLNVLGDGLRDALDPRAKLRVRA